MELKDFLCTPIILLLVYFLAYTLRTRFTNENNRRYFIPALTIKIAGAIGLGLIYQFYYQGGDTYNYFEQCVHIYQSIFDSPLITLKLLFSDGSFAPSTFLYSQHIYWFTSPSEYLIIKLAAFFGLFCFGTYSSIAVMFACFSFSGLWAAYTTFLKEYPSQEGPLALALFFLPSVFFWGSGLMKDTVAITALGWLFYAFYQIFILKENLLYSTLVLIITVYILYTIRIFVLLSFLPPAIVWVFLQNSTRIQNRLVRFLAGPILLVIGLSTAIYVGMNVTEGHVKYDIDEIGKRTKINAEYLYRISLQEGGSAYYLGDLDGSIMSMIRLAPQALVVTLFRPFLWEAKNIMMLLSAIEALIFLILTSRLLLYPGLFKSFKILLKEPMLLFCLIYSVVLAVAVGLNSYNFGSLVRYKIQILPFYLSMVLILWNYNSQASKKTPRKVSV